MMRGIILVVPFGIAAWYVVFHIVKTGIQVLLHS